jgi:hypothetical protein
MDCAYCGAKGTMTREHVFSDWISREFRDIGPMESTVQGAPARRYQSLIKTNDVCQPCNNEHLAQLDDFAKGLGMHADRNPSDPKAFSADRDKLTRHLLKCGYNDARANLKKAQNAGGPTTECTAWVREHRQFALFILGKAGPPMPLDVLAGTLEFSPSVGAARMELEDSGNQIHFNRWIHLAAHCFLLIGWLEGTTDFYRKAVIMQLCSPPWNWTWLEQAVCAVLLRRVAIAGAILPSGETLPRPIPD